MNELNPGINGNNIKKVLTYVADSKLPPSTKEIENYMGMEHDSWQRLVTFCESNNLIVWVSRPLDPSKPTNLENCMEVTKNAVNYLIQEEHLTQQKSHDNVIKLATIAIAIATAVNVILAFLK